MSEEGLGRKTLGFVWAKGVEWNSGSGFASAAVATGNIRRIWQVLYSVIPESVWQFQIHFYKNPMTGEVFYGFDYKVVFNNISGADGIS
jgi:hypothetical protein